MNNKIPTGTLALTLLAVVAYIMLTEITLVFGPVVMPFAIYLLLKIKKQSTVNYWILFFSFIIPAMLFLSPLASASFIILYIVSSLLAYTLEQKVSQEMTLFYTTFALGLSTMAAVVIMQMLGFLRPLSDLYSSFRNWYETQLETVSSLTTDAMDADMILQSLDLYFQNMPAFVMIGSFFLALYIVLMVRILPQDNTKMWTYRTFDKWMMPRMLLYLYLLLFFIMLFSGGWEESTVTLISNISLILEWALFIHGLAFIYYFMLRKSMNKVLAAVVLIPFALLRPITVLIGLFEMIFRIRLIMELRRK
ncbi:MAG TPA: YybS family protein [Jeotgalicoccus aerolatus]|nr:YybS family protein [Jeotgalicoccus aerolatus]